MLLSRYLSALLFLSLLSGRLFGQTPEMVFVEGGTFTMGSPESEEGRNDDETEHQVTVSSFFIGRYEVTQGEWEAVMGRTLREQSEISNYPGIYGEGSGYAIYHISWFDAVEYCNALSEREGLTQVYTFNDGNVTADWSANGYRLPTEAEWEYAARGGSADSSTVYPGSDNPDDVAWYWRNSGDGYLDGELRDWNRMRRNNCRTRPVGQRQANELGLYDMGGNVAEWCWDWPSDYRESSSRDPHGPPIASFRVLRGGSWSFFASDCRVAARSYFIPSIRFFHIGFRLVRTG